MIYTARQLDDLWKAAGGTGQIVLPFRARLTPLAADWIKEKRITLEYSDGKTSSAGDGGAVSCCDGPVKTCSACASKTATASNTFLWWCDGPCGTAKAALMAVGRESSLAELDKPADVRQLPTVVKHLSAQVKAGHAAGGILMVQSAAGALVLANRCPSLRAIVGTCLQTVEQGIAQVAANVLVIEYPYQTLQQIRNLLSRFVRANRQVSDELNRQLGELASCG
ncbi:MAG: RpiB/LacA/LacB family sugar-phosphate isomerase [Phycisphaerales bacterium]|jgi:ribose 5-phosphate isomerase RpiB|nr:RpiB/LacA/LacB family sugar-phosphate isomerase [Phycisphaerales bacterium]